MKGLSAIVASVFLAPSTIMAANVTIDATETLQSAERMRPVLWRFPMAPEAAETFTDAMMLLVPQGKTGKRTRPQDARLILSEAGVWPRVQSATVNGRIVVRNLSSKTIQCKAEGAAEFVTGKLAAGGAFEHQVSQTGTVNITCDDLLLPHASIEVIEAGWSATAFDKGVFSFKGVPSGHYEARLYLGTKLVGSSELDVSAGGTKIAFSVSETGNTEKKQPIAKTTPAAPSQGKQPPNNAAKPPVTTAPEKKAAAVAKKLQRTPEATAAAKKISEPKPRASASVSARKKVEQPAKPSAKAPPPAASRAKASAAARVQKPKAGGKSASGRAKPASGQKPSKKEKQAKSGFEDVEPEIEIEE